jgi:hypothetical protein
VRLDLIRKREIDAVGDDDGNAPGCDRVEKPTGRGRITLPMHKQEANDPSPLSERDPNGI